MEIKGKIEEKFFMFDSKIAFLVFFMFILFAFSSFTIFAMIGYFLMGEGKGETKPQILRHSETICENVRFALSFELECERFAHKQFPDFVCTTKLRSTEPNVFGQCVICTVECSR